jgi:hypothetical protein
LDLNYVFTGAWKGRIAPSPFDTTVASWNGDTMLTPRKMGGTALANPARSWIAGELSASNARASLGSIILEAAQ